MPSTKNSPTIVELAEHQLKVTDSRFSRCVSCHFQDGTLVLQGQVPTYYLKQIAQTAVAAIPGVEQVDNRIQVFASLSP